MPARCVGANIVGVEGKHLVRTVLVRFEAPDRVQFLGMSISTALDALSRIGMGLQRIEAKG